MDVDRFERLSSRQLDCLRLLLVEGSSKAVAEELRISPGTVDQHLKAARRVLGVSDSWTAAQMVLRHEDAIQKLDTYSPAVVSFPDVGPSVSGTNDRSREGSESEPADVTGDGHGFSRTLWPLLFPSLGRQSNDLNAQDRLLLMAIQAAIAAGSAAVLFVLVYAMSQFLIHAAEKTADNPLHRPMVIRAL